MKRTAVLSQLHRDLEMGFDFPSMERVRDGHGLRWGASRMG